MIDPLAKIHPQALIEPHTQIGANTRIWAFAHVLSHVVIGEDCNICDHTLIENGVMIGDRVTIKSGVYIWEGVNIENDVFIGPCVAFINDKHPRSKRYLTKYPTTILKQGASIGANATLLAGITIGNWAMVGAGSVVTQSFPAHALIYGNPAKLKGWVCICGNKINTTATFVCECGLTYQFDNGKLRRIN